MSDTTPQAEGFDMDTVPGTEGVSTRPGLSGIPVTEIKPDGEMGPTRVPPAEIPAQDIGTLSIRYIGAVPQIVVTGGHIVPSSLTVVDGSGTVLAAYAGRPASAAHAGAKALKLNLFLDSMVLTGTQGAAGE
ncbi:hypothetical protein ACH46F_02865 [Streptomyces virginiae]|uniref:hypothetical protein n=1 Tax=Streptomyces virginiae TaxID=1961 RepID=UPI003792FBE4